MANENKDVNKLPETGIVIQNITIRPAHRKSQDIDAWRNAIRTAEGINQQRQLLYDLYEDIVLDAVLSSLIEKRVLGVTKTKMLFVDKDGKEIESMTELLACKQFRELRKEVMRQKVYGISVIELIKDSQGFRIFSVPRKHIRPKEGIITYEQWGMDGIRYRELPTAKYVLEVGHWNDFGLLMKAAQYVIYKRGGFGDWAHFVEIFGMPFREARYDGYNTQVRAQLEQALEQAGSAGYAILPKEAELTFHEAGNTQSTGELYNALRKACNEELSILFLGQTETTAKTAGKLGGNDQTHEQTENDINSDDRADELSIFNELVKPILANLGYPVADGHFIYQEEADNTSVKDKVETVIKLRNEAKLPIADDYIYEMSGIPKPDNYDEIKAEQQAQADAMREQLDGGNKPPKNKKPGNEDDDETTEEKLAWVDRFRLSLADFFGPAPKS